MRVEGCRLKNVTFILAEMRARRRRTGDVGGWGGAGRAGGWALERPGTTV